MIIQSSNEPIMLEMPDNLEGTPIRAVLSKPHTDQILKTWEKEDILFHDNIVELPLTQNETSEFQNGYAILNMKWLNAEGYTDFIKPEDIYIMSYPDKEPLGYDQSEVN